MDRDPAARTVNRQVTGVIMRKPRVIIYDDDVGLLELLEACFTRWGYEVFSYCVPVVCPVNGNPAQGCNCQAPCADLMISDFLMPKTTGTELFWHQAERGCKVAKKAIMSGYPEEKLLRFCEDAGYRYLEKPFNYEKLTSWLRECKGNFDLSKQLGGRPAKVRHAFRTDKSAGSPGPGVFYPLPL
jgi:DNA-binding NtrC family response regulator